MSDEAYSREHLLLLAQHGCSMHTTSDLRHFPKGCDLCKGWPFLCIFSGTENRKWMSLADKVFYYMRLIIATTVILIVPRSISWEKERIDRHTISKYVMTHRVSHNKTVFQIVLFRAYLPLGVMRLLVHHLMSCCCGNTGGGDVRLAPYACC